MTHPTAQTILNQLGGHRFIAMTGAKNLVGGSESLSFHIGRNSAKIAGVRIILNANDLYDVVFLKKAKKDPVFGISVGMEVASRLDDVHADALREVFTRYTGLETKL